MYIVYCVLVFFNLFSTPRFGDLEVYGRRREARLGISRSTFARIMMMIALGVNQLMRQAVLSSLRCFKSVSSSRPFDPSHTESKFRSLEGRRLLFKFKFVTSGCDTLYFVKFTPTALRS